MKTNYKRTKDTPAIQIMETDEAIFKALYEYVILDVEHLCTELDFPSVLYTRTRLKKLYDHGYLARPPIQDNIYRMRRGKGSRPLVHSLGQKGAKYLRDKFFYPLKSTNYDDKARDRKGRRGEAIFEHDLGCNGLLVALKKAYKARRGVRVLSPRDVIEQSPQATRAMNSPFSLPSKYLWSEDNKRYERRVVPDGLFAYQTKRDNKTITRLVFIEYDNDTMPIRRKRGNETSIKQKIAAYSGLHLKQVIKQRFGIEEFHVLFVTTGSAQHRDNMVEATAEYCKPLGNKIPVGLFFFATVQEFNTAQTPLEKIWVTYDGSVRRFVKAS